MTTVTVGTVRELWRYPFKSMAGERLTECALGPDGLVGDRGWAARDEDAHGLRGAKKLPALMQCSARYVSPPSSAATPAVEITFPDGTRARSDTPAAAAGLSRLTGRRLTLWPRQPKDALEHYRRGAPDHADLEAELRSIFGRLPDEPLPDLGTFPPEVLEYESPPGTHFDAFPVHILTTGWLAALAQANPAARFDVRRFRPNLLIEPAAPEPRGVEIDWVGKSLRIGSARVAVTVPCPRCIMTTLPQGDLEKDPLEKDPSVLRTIVRDSGQNVGVYASVMRPGRLAVGDAVVLEGVS